MKKAAFSSLCHFKIHSISVFCDKPNVTKRKIKQNGLLCHELLLLLLMLLLLLFKFSEKLSHVCLNKEINLVSSNFWPIIWQNNTSSFTQIMRVIYLQKYFTGLSNFTCFPHLRPQGCFYIWRLFINDDPNERISNNNFKKR